MEKKVAKKFFSKEAATRLTKENKFQSFTATERKNLL